MAKIKYWDGVLNLDANLELNEKIKALLACLMRGETKGLKFEKLTGQDNLYSIRLDKKARLLFTIAKIKDKNYAVLLEYLPNHEYDKSKFLRIGLKDLLPANVLSEGVKFQSKEQSEEQEGVEKQIAVEQEFVFYELSDDDVELNEIKRLFAGDSPEVAVSEARSESLAITKADFLHKKFVVLDENQASIQSYSGGIAVIDGAAGTGKTTLAQKLLQQVSQWVFSIEKSANILYVAKSKRLVEEVKAACEPILNLRGEEEGFNFAFFSYEELFQHEHRAKVSLEDFKTWFAEQTQKATETKGEGKKTGKRKTTNYPAEDCYADFQVISGLEKKEDYLSLGVAQTLVPSEGRSAALGVFESYIKYLQSNNKIDLSLIRLALPDSYGLIIADEIQDLSPTQIKTLFIATKQADNSYNFVGAGDINQCMQRISITVEHCINQIAKGAKQKITHYHLPSNYRVPRQIIEVANRVLAVKSQMYGGVVAKDAYTAMSSSQNSAASSNAFFFYTTEDKSYIELLREKCSASANVLVVVDDESLIAEAEEIYGKDAIVLTVEQAKGLEDETIIYHRPLHSADVTLKAANQAVAAFKEQGEEGEAVLVPAKKNLPKNKEKIGKGEHILPLNKMFVALTRSTRELYIVVDSEELVKSREFFEYIKGDLTVVAPISTGVSSHKDWEDKLGRLNKEVVRQGAIDRVNERLNKNSTEGAGSAVPVPGEKVTTIKKLAGTNAGGSAAKQGKDVETIIKALVGRLIVNPTVTNFKMILTSRSYCLKVLGYGMEHENVLAWLYREHPAELNKAISDKDTQVGFLSSLDNNEETFAQILIKTNKAGVFANHSALFWISQPYTGQVSILDIALKGKPRIAKFITAESLMLVVKKSLPSGVQPTAFLNFASMERTQETLFCLLEENPGIVKGITAESLISCFEENASVLYLLIETEIGLKVLAYILEKNPNVAKGITVASLVIRRRGYRTGLSILLDSGKGEKILALLSATNSEIKKMIVDVNVHDYLNKEGSVEQAHVVVPEKDEAAIIVAKLFIALTVSSIKAIFSSRKWCLKILGYELKYGNVLLWMLRENSTGVLEAVRDVVEKEAFFSSLKDNEEAFAQILIRTINGGEVSNDSALYCLTCSSNGIGILSIWLKSNPIAKFITAEILTSIVTLRNVDRMPLSNLVRNLEGREVLFYLLVKNPEIAKGITAESLILLVEENRVKRVSVLWSLAKTNTGQKILAHILEKNSEISKGITVESLKGVGYEGETALSLFLGSDMGRKILKTLSVANSKIAKINEIAKIVADVNLFKALTPDTEETRKYVSPNDGKCGSHGDSVSNVPVGNKFYP